MGGGVDPVQPVSPYLAVGLDVIVGDAGFLEAAGGAKAAGAGTDDEVAVAAVGDGLLT